tara:strand:+ start:38564 stop:39619 length:1056 start_codon:yes stop_codon:yes gene_type:complete
MEKIIYYLNDNYEQCLSSGKIIENQHSVWDDLFLWCENADVFLKTNTEYNPKFLDYIEKTKEEECPNVVKVGRAKPWWGKYDQIELAKKINSKEFSFELSKQLGLINHDGGIFFGRDIEFKKNYICKDIYSFSGINTFITNIPETLKFLNMDSKYLYEENLPRIADFGTSLMPDGKIFFSENIINKNFFYKGSFVGQLEDKTHVEQSLKPVFKEIKKLGWEDVIQIDSIKYQKSTKTDYYLLMEINARKSMGLISNLMKNKINLNSPLAGWFIFNKKDLRVKTFTDCLLAIEDDLLEKNDQKGVVITSSFHYKFVHFLIFDDSKKEINLRLMKLWKKVSDKRLPIEFIIDF